MKWPLLSFLKSTPTTPRRTRLLYKYKYNSKHTKTLHIPSNDDFKLFKSAVPPTPPHLFHEPEPVRNIVNGQQYRGQHLLRDEQMMQVRPHVVCTRVTVTPFH